MVRQTCARPNTRDGHGACRYRRMMAVRRIHVRGMMRPKREAGQGQRWDEYCLDQHLAAIRLRSMTDTYQMGKQLRHQALAE